MGIFSRMFKVGQAQAHAVVDKLEDPIKLTNRASATSKLISRAP